MKRVSTLLLSLMCAAVLLTAVAPAQVSAFPGAYGFGSEATGGRGGAIYHVTNLEDSGPGSFRDAVSQGNRIVVFDVGGYIVLDSPVSVSSNITIAGQTAPSGAIGIMGAEVSLSNHSNIIIRNLRIRQGKLDPLTGKSALNMGNGSNIILDHCSFEYGQWDSVDAVKTTNFTVQDSIIADPIGQQFGAHVERGPSTFYRDLWGNAHNRQPLSKDNTQYINNVVYDYQAGYTAANTGGFFSHDIVGNYFIAGPATTSAENAFFQMNSKQSVFAAGNMLDSNNDGLLNGTPYNTVGSSVVLAAPWSPTTASIPTLTAEDAYASVLASAGAQPRDSVDELVLSQVASLGLSGQLYKDQAATGLANDGYGVLSAGTPFADQNGDGIADYWASANGISTTDPQAGGYAYRNTGYTNLEAYINSLVLPDDWQPANLTGASVQSAASYNPFTKKWLLASGGGSDLNSLDTGEFASCPWSTDGSLAARLGPPSQETHGARAGLMIRESDAPGAPFVALVSSHANGLSFVWRNTQGEDANSIHISFSRGPVWLRITRNSNAYVGLASLDGRRWFLIGVAHPSLSSIIRAGLIATSSGNSAAVAVFTNVEITSAQHSLPRLQ